MIKELVKVQPWYKSNYCIKGWVFGTGAGAVRYINLPKKKMKKFPGVVNKRQGIDFECIQ